MAEAWLDLAEQTTQVVDHEADEAHSMIEQPLKRASVQDQHSENRRQVIMPTRDDDYQAMAEECFRRARVAESDRERQGYLELAQTWLEAASKVDCGPFLSLPSRCWR
jgi:hypothetical protein